MLPIMNLINSYMSHLALIITYMIISTREHLHHPSKDRWLEQCSSWHEMAPGPRGKHHHILHERRCPSCSQCHIRHHRATHLRLPRGRLFYFYRCIYIFVLFLFFVSCFFYIFYKHYYCLMMIRENMFCQLCYFIRSRCYRHR